MNAILGVDVGATTIAAGLVTHAGEVLQTVQRPTHVDGAGTVVKTLLALVEELVAVADERGLTIDGVGVGVPGVVDVERGLISVAPPGNRVRELRDVPIAEEISRITGLPAFVENDANALALAESMFGVARAARSLVLFAIGTEIGGGLVLDGHLVRGARGLAAELHNVPVKFDGARCRCGGRGCLGAYVGGRVIAEEARRRVADGTRSSVVELAGGDADAVTSRQVFQAATLGDPMARAVVDAACDALAAGIGVVIGCLDPEVVVVTGGVAQSLVPLADAMRRRVADYSMPLEIPPTRIEIVSGGKGQSVRGGAALFLYHRSLRHPTRG